MTTTTTPAARTITLIETTYMLALLAAIAAGCTITESECVTACFTITAPDGRQLRTFAGPVNADGAHPFRAAYHLDTYAQAWRGLDTVREFAAGAR